MWSDGAITDVVKPYHELHSFHTEVGRTDCFVLTLYGHIKTAEQRTIIQQYGDRHTSCYIRYSKERPWQAAAPPIPLTVPNVTAHPLTASVLISCYSIWQYNCLGFNYDKKSVLPCCILCVSHTRRLHQNRQTYQQLSFYLLATSF